MKHFLLKFNHGVEIGAMLAYIGHYFRTEDERVWEIAMEEVRHPKTLEHILKEYDQKPSKLIDKSFGLVGTVIKYLCKICPIWSLDLVARSMELFAVFNYRRLEKIYPKHANTFWAMALAEEQHGKYFARKK